MEQYNVFMKHVLKLNGFGPSFEDRLAISLIRDFLWFLVSGVCTRMYALACSHSYRYIQQRGEWNERWKKGISKQGWTNKNNKNKMNTDSEK